MKYILIDIPSEVSPSQKYYLAKNVWVFPSSKTKETKVVNEEIYTSLLFSIEKSESNKEQLKNCITQYIVFLNFIHQDYPSVKWLINENLGDHLGNVQEVDTINEIFERFEPKKRLKPDFLYHDFEKFSLPYHKPGHEKHVNFIDLFSRFYRLSEDSPLKHRIELYSFIWTIKPLLSKFYKNDNLDIGLTYTLIDSLIDDYIEKVPIIKKCTNCGFEFPARKSDKIRIKEFVNFFAPEDSEDLYFKIIWNLYNIRNKFFHEGVKPTTEQTSSKAFERLKSKTGKEMMSLSDEAEFHQSRSIGALNIKLILKTILIEKLTQL